MTLLRRNSNFGSYDIAPQLQATLNANGMQAHLSQTSSGEMQLITLAHNSSTPRYYTLTQSQVENLRSGGTNSFNRKAYETFTSIVKNDYYMPNAWVTAKNANSPVNMGQWGHTIMDGEYGYREPKFHPFMGAKYGKLALDQRLINPLLPDSESSKVNSCCENIYRIWDENVVVEIPVQAGEKKFKYEQKVKLVNPKLYGRGYAIGDMGHTDYVLVADDIVAVEEK